MLEAQLLLPLIGSGLIFAFRNAGSRYWAVGIALVQMILTFYMLSIFNNSPTIDSELQFEITKPWSNAIKSSLHFGVDGMSMLMLILTNILTPFIILSTFNDKSKYNPNFYALVLLMQFGLIGVFTALDGLLFYVFWEVTLIPIWFIAGLWGDEEKRIRVTTKFFVYTFVGSLFMLVGLIYVYQNAASFDLTDLYNAHLNASQEILVFWLIFIAFAVKLPLIPLHNWQAETYTFSPTPATMLLSGIMLKMAIYGVLRYLLPIAPNALLGTSGQVVMIVSVLGVVYGALIAIVHHDIKKIIAFSSLSHVGLIVAGIFASAILTAKGNFTMEGAEGALVQAFAHGINVVGLFYCADILIKKFNTRDIREMGGYAQVAPKFATLFMIILLGAMAVPLTNGFVGEFILLKSIFDYDKIVVVFAGLTVILCAVYLLRLYGKAMFGKGNEEIVANLKDISTVEFVVLASLAIFVVVLGIFPSHIIDMVNSSLKLIYSSIKS